MAIERVTLKNLQKLVSTMETTYAKKNDLESKADKATTLAGYGITDAMTTEEIKDEGYFHDGGTVFISNLLEGDEYKNYEYGSVFTIDESFTIPENNTRFETPYRGKTYPAMTRVLLYDAMGPRLRVVGLPFKGDVVTPEEVDTKINAKIVGAYKAGGSVTFANLPTLEEANLGVIVNVTDAFTTTDSFVEGAGVAYNAGTNVVVVEVNEVYKYDALGGASMIDLSNYSTTEQMNSAISAAVEGTLQESDFVEYTDAQIDALWTTANQEENTPAE